METMGGTQRQKTLVGPEVGIDSIQETLSRPVSHLTEKQTYIIEIEK